MGRKAGAQETCKVSSACVAVRELRLGDSRGPLEICVPKCIHCGKPAKEERA